MTTTTNPGSPAPAGGRRLPPRPTPIGPVALLPAHQVCGCQPDEIEPGTIADPDRTTHTTGEMCPRPKMNATAARNWRRDFYRAHERAYSYKYR